MIVTVKEMKDYLRVDFDDDDRLLSDLIEQGQQICMDVARIADEDVFEEFDEDVLIVFTAEDALEHKIGRYPTVNRISRHKSKMFMTTKV